MASGDHTTLPMPRSRHTGSTRRSTRRYRALYCGWLLAGGTHPSARHSVVAWAIWSAVHSDVPQ